jgi:hypothetical protein
LGVIVGSWHLALRAWYPDGQDLELSMDSHVIQEMIALLDSSVDPKDMKV